MKIMVLRYVYGYASALLRARAPITAGILLAVLGTACLHTMPTQWRVGAARVDITPDAAEIAAGNIWLGGFGSCLLDSRRATGVHDPIHARAMVISDGATTVAHVMADTPGISNRRIKAIRQRAFDATGIPRSNIMVGATHTHSGPDMVGIWCGVSDSYESSFDQRVAQAVIEAHQSLQPATLLARVAPLSNMQTNRRGWNITDEDLAVLQARDSDDRPIGTIVEFAAHATCIGKENTLISRDWVGRVQDRIEGSGNGIALVNTGDQGDVIPKDCGSGFGGAEAFGASIADAARDRIATAEELTPPLVYAVANKRIPITNAVFLAALAFGWLDYDIIYLCPEGGYIGNPCIATDVAYLRFGPADACQLQVAVAPAEVLTSGGMAIKPAFVAPQKMFLGQTHNTLGYAVPSQEWNGSPIGRTYEETMSPTPSFGDTVVNAIISLAADDDCAVMMSP